MYHFLVSAEKSIFKTQRAFWRHRKYHWKLYFQHRRMWFLNWKKANYVLNFKALYIKIQFCSPFYLDLTITHTLSFFKAVVKVFLVDLWIRGLWDPWMVFRMGYLANDTSFFFAKLRLCPNVWAYHSSLDNRLS